MAFLFGDIMKKYIGDKAFYKAALSIAVPIMLQNGINNFVNMLDNIMIGRTGTEQMSGVSIVNQLLFVFQLCLFGALSGAGILGAQFYGQKNNKGVRDVFRIKIFTALIILFVAIAIFLFGHDALIGIYLDESNDANEIALTLKYAVDYLLIMLIGLIPMAVEMSYSSTLRECGETKVSMKASFVAVFVNLVLNYILIYGMFGAPKLGVMGAAWATVVSRFIQMTLVVSWSHKHIDNETAYLEGAFSADPITDNIVGKVILLGLPLMLNETMWSAGCAAVNSCYAYRGLGVVAALNIQGVIYNIFNIMFIAMGDAVAIMVGQELGANNIEKAKDTAGKLTAFGVASCVIFGILMYLVAPYFPRIYNTTDEIKHTATTIIRFTAFVMPIHAYLHCIYFALRSGGKTVITFLFDSVYLWTISFPAAWVIANYTGMAFVYMFLCINLIDLIKVTIGTVLYRSGIWAKNITT